MEATDSVSRNRDSDEFTSHEKDPHPFSWKHSSNHTYYLSIPFLNFFSPIPFTSFMGKQTPNKTNQHQVLEEEEEEEEEEKEG